jgi:hypothetical protein
MTCGGRGRQAQAAVAARAGVLHPLVADHAHLLRHDVQLLADLHADLAQRRAVVRAHALVLGQFVAHAPRAAGRGPAACGRAWCACAPARRPCRLRPLRLQAGPVRPALGLVEEQVLLVRGADFALGVEELALEAVELLLEQVALGAHHAQLAQCIAQRLLQRFESLRAWACGSSARILFIAMADVAVIFASARNNADARATKSYSGRVCRDGGRLPAQATRSYIRWGWRCTTAMSMPSSSQCSCSTVNVGTASAAGQMKRSCSRRLSNNQ